MANKSANGGTADSNNQGNHNQVVADSGRVGSLFERWDKELEDFDVANKSKLYDEFKEILSKDGNNYDVLWRMSKVCLILSAAAENDKNDGLNKKLSEEALSHSSRAVRLEPNKVKGQKWLCASLGKMTKFVGIKQKIKYGQQFKEHIDIAIKLDPNDYLLHFMLGRFSYELSSLSWLERRIASALFGRVPASSYEDALTAFIQCDRLKPQWKDNYLWIAKTLIQLKRKPEAKEWINNGLALISVNLLDQMAHRQLIKLKTQHKL